MITRQVVRDGGTPSVVPPSQRPAGAGTTPWDATAVPATDRPGAAVPARAGTAGAATGGTPQGAAAGTTGTVPGPDRPGTGRLPRVWTRDADAPGTDVRAIYDGVSYYRRTAADRWVPDGCSGPGFAWREVPAALRVEAAGEHRTGPDGALVIEREAEGFGGSVGFGAARRTASSAAWSTSSAVAGDANGGHGQ